MAEQFTLTTSGVAHGVPCNPATVRAYGDMGLLRSIRVAGGTRLFPHSAIEETRRILAERLANKGQRKPR